VLTVVLPLVMLGVWLTIAEQGAVGSYDRNRFIAYYLAAFLVRNITGVWMVWEMDEDFRLGKLSFRLLKPMNPIIHYMGLALSSKPLRFVVLVPVWIGSMIFIPELNLAKAPVTLLLFLVSLAGAWSILFLMQYTIGLLSFWTTQTLNVNEFWFLIFSLASGYLIPLDLFPPAVHQVLLALPFRYGMSFPVEILTNRLALIEILRGLLIQWVWVGVVYAVYRWVWTKGIKHHSAVGI
jgi:ABC-2 type transport system permease protein